MLNIEILGSSSKGNCYIIRTADEVLLLECGLYYNIIMQALDYNISNVIGCLISHEHKDHSKSAKHLAERGVDIYSSFGTLKALEALSKNHPHRARELEANKEVVIGGFTILPFAVEHDAADPFGYLIYHKEFGKLLFATDTYYIKYKFNALNYIMLECNFSKEILDKNIEAGKLNPLMKKRLLTSHFSLENVKKFLQANDLSQLKEVMLIHLSDGNSNAAQFKDELEKLTGCPVRICG